MKTKIVKHGNSRAVVIPAAVANRLGWRVGTDVDVEQLAAGVVLRPPRRKSLKSALAHVIKENDEILRELAGL